MAVKTDNVAYKNKLVSIYIGIISTIYITFIVKML